MDRIEITYTAIDQMIEAHNTPKPEILGGGLYNALEEFEIYKNQVGNRYTPLQWVLITSYFNLKFKDIEGGVK